MNRDNKPWRKPYTKKIGIAAVLFVAIVVSALVIWLPKPKPAETVSLSEAAAAISSGEVVRIEDRYLSGDFVLYYRDGTSEGGRRDPSSSLLEQFSLLGLSEEQLNSVEIEIARGSAASATNPVSFLFTFGLLGIVGYVAVRMNRTDRVGRKKYEETDIPKTGFADVAGLDDNLQELRDIVVFLKEGQKFAEMGARMPRGVLMVGDPGTGKTLVARAVAGEAGVPFFATSGSEFTEVFVGVGASRMRALFAKARKKAPCIVFIDEIDAVGRARHRSESGAEMEQDQTLNQLLVEMDGFAGAEGVVVLAATNRVDVLDSALTRPGRFDRRVYVNRPDVKGRQDILAIHTRGKKLGADVDLSVIARATPGLVGADLANIVNEAAIIAVRNGRSEMHLADFEEAVEKHIAGGVPRKGQVMGADEKKIIAYHEAGHAVVMHLTEHSDPVFKITIIPRGQAGGYTMAVPEEDRMLISRCRILARITGLLGGRVAEELFFQDITSGASNDLNVATQLAEEMVMRLGMDRRTGLRVFPSPHERPPFSMVQGSQKTFETIDETVRDILDSCYTEARRLLVERSKTVERIANQLLDVETLGREEFVRLMEE
jgi:cell division protease FtsH